MSETRPIDQPDFDRSEAPLTVLQLDTAFPRIKGDVACPDTYLKPIQIKRIDQAAVGDVITDTPDQTEIKKFEQACAEITMGMGVTSCGFLGYWQNHLDQICPSPFIASSLIDLPNYRQHYDDDALAIVTFDDKILSTPLYRDLRSGFSGQVIGLRPDMHLRQVIADDRPDLDFYRAQSEILSLLEEYLSGGQIKALVFECTNLPPYKAAIKDKFDIEIYDILTSIHARDPELVRPELL